MHTSVSVILPAYNAEGFILRALQSAMSQTLPPLEIIVIDDCSTDGTVRVVENTIQGRGGNLVRLLKTPVNSGPAAARNLGIDNAKGEWIAILDADDAFLPERLARLIPQAMAACADVIADNLVYYYPDTNTASPPLFAGVARTIDITAYFSAARPAQKEADYGLLKPLFNRGFLNHHHLRYPEFSRHGEDFLFMTEILLKGAKYNFQPETGYLYTARSSGQSRTLIDYRGMIRHTEDLIRDPRIASHPEMIGLLKERQDGLEELAIAHDFSIQFQNKHYARILRSLKSAKHIKVFVKKALKFLTRT